MTSKELWPCWRQVTINLRHSAMIALELSGKICECSLRNSRQVVRVHRPVGREQAKRRSGNCTWLKHRLLTPRSTRTAPGLFAAYFLINLAKMSGD